MWERLALMKVRPVAGDIAFGESLAVMLREIAFGWDMTPDDVAHIETLRDRLTGNAAAGDLKHAPGGLSDIELATRLMQLRHARQCPEVWHWGVFRALDALESHKLEPAEDLETLRDGYLYLRRVLNRLRMARGSSATAFPGEEERLYLGRRLRLNDDPLKIAMEKMDRVKPITDRMLAWFREHAEQC